MTYPSGSVLGLGCGTAGTANDMLSRVVQLCPTKLVLTIAK